MIEKYKSNKSRRRVSFHLGACTLIFLVFSIISKTYILALVLLFLFIICLMIYIKSLKNMNKIEKHFISKCSRCGKDIHYNKTVKYLLYNQNVNETDFNTNFSTDKKKIEIEKYYCIECKLCFSIIKTYQMKNNGDYVLMKTEKNLDDNYNNNY